MNDAVATPTAPQFVDAGKRVKMVTLEWPLVFDGVEYREIGLKRLTAAEVADFARSLAGAPKDVEVVLPIFCAADGSPLPKGLLDALDVDDRDALNEEGLSFLPRRFRGVGSNASAPAVGAPIASSSTASAA